MKKDVFQAIADPTRRAILVLIATQALTPNAIAEQFASSRQAVSKHLQVLKDAELINHVKSGREIYYHFNASRLREVDQWLSGFRELWENRFNQLDELLNNLKTDENETESSI